MTAYVIDTSVLAKYFTDEPNEDIAKAIVRQSVLGEYHELQKITLF